MTNDEIFFVKFIRFIHGSQYINEINIVSKLESNDQIMFANMKPETNEKIGENRIIVNWVVSISEEDTGSK